MTRLVEVDNNAMEANDSVQANARRILIDVIDHSGLSKSEISRRANRSRPQVNTALASNASMNLRTLTHFLYAAGYQLRLEAVPISGDGPVFD